jgi:hypothetical protein
MDTHHSEGEIVIKITPRNLERLIYILIILGLLIFSIVQVVSKDCPDECKPKTNEINNNAVTEVKEETKSTTEITVTETVQESTNTEIQTTQTMPLSGEIEFMLDEVKLCIQDEDTDTGRIDSVSVIIKNGYDRLIKTRLDIYLWDSNDDDTLKMYPASKIEKINILSGASLTHIYTVGSVLDGSKFTSKGMFIETDLDKTVKVKLIDIELNKVIKEKIVTKIKTTKDC